jgi:LETM1 and EF-hand domain-containing protein 1
VAAEEKTEDDARMTKEQLGELAEALNILTAKSSIIKEREELKAILEDNLLSEAVRHSSCQIYLTDQIAGV